MKWKISVLIVLLWMPGAWAANDEGLLQALLDLSQMDNTEARVQAAKALGDLADERAIEPLANALKYDQPLVRRTAALALGQYPTPLSVAALKTALTDEDISVRVAAVDALGGHNTDAAARTLFAALDSANIAIGIRIRGVLHEKYPMFVANLPEDERPALLGGVVIAGTAMAFHGGIFMSALTHLADGDAGGLAFTSGAILGAVTPPLLTWKRGMSLSEGAWIASTPTWGAISGAMLTGWADGDTDALAWSVIGGQVVGLTAGLLTLDTHSFTAGEVGFTSLGGIMGGFGGLGASWILEADSEAAFGAAQIGMTIGLLSAGLTAGGVDSSKGDQALVAMGTLSGGWAAVWGSDALGGHSQVNVGAFFLGSAVGFATSAVLTPVFDMDPGNVGEVGMDGIWGASVGSGIAGMLGDDLSDEAYAGLVVAGSILGWGAGIMTAEESHFSPGDRVLIGSSAVWGLWQFGGFAHIYGTTFEEDLGASLLGLGLSGAGAALASQYSEPTPTEILYASAGGAWGGWLGGWSLAVADRFGANVQDNSYLLAILLGSDGGLLGTGLTLAMADLPPQRLGWINVSGLVGMGLGVAMTVPMDEAAVGTLVGSTVGLVGGVIATHFIDFEQTSSKSHAMNDATQIVTDVAPLFGPTTTEDGQTGLTLGLQGRWW